MDEDATIKKGSRSSMAREFIEDVRSRISYETLQRKHVISPERFDVYKAMAMDIIAKEEARKSGTQIKISAARILDDLRSGMDDSAIMKKYSLSDKGLADLFRQLSSIGLIRWLNAQDIVSDIKKGMCDEDLIEKYKLSWTGLESLFSELVKTGVSVPSRDLARARIKRKISQPDIVHDIHSGMTEAQLMEKYDLSSWGIRNVLSKLLNLGAITWEEMAILSLNGDDSVTLRDMRQYQRRYPLVSVIVYEQIKPMVKGRVCDISEKGLGVIGIPSEVDDLKTLTVAPDELRVFEPFTLQASCRWFRQGDLDINCTAGFAITHIGEPSLEPFRDLLESMTEAFPS